jgi:hypothetical protein
LSGDGPYLRVLGTKGCRFFNSGTECFAQFKLEPTEGSTEKVNKIKILKKKIEGNSTFIHL